MESSIIENKPKTKKRSSIKAVILLLIALVFVIFAIQNSNPISLNLIFTKTDQPLSVILLTFFLAGFLIGLFFWMSSVWGHRKVLKQKNNSIKELEDRLIAVQSKIDELSQASSE